MNLVGSGSKLIQKLAPLTDMKIVHTYCNVVWAHGSQYDI